MVGTHILVLKLQLITFNLLWYYKGLISGCSPAVFTFACKLGCRLDSMVLKWKFEHGSNTILCNSKANRTVSQGYHGLMHLLTHEHNAMKAGENKPLTVSKQWRFWSCKMHQGLLFCFCFSSHVRPLEWWYKQWPGCCHLRDQDEAERHIFNLYALYIRWAVTADNYSTWCVMRRVNKEKKKQLTSGHWKQTTGTCKLNLLMSQAQAHHTTTTHTGRQQNTPGLLL